MTFFRSRKQVQFLICTRVLSYCKVYTRLVNTGMIIQNYAKPSYNTEDIDFLTEYMWNAYEVGQHHIIAFVMFYIELQWESLVKSHDHKFTKNILLKHTTFKPSPHSEEFFLIKMLRPTFSDNTDSLPEPVLLSCLPCSTSTGTSLTV